MPKIIVSTTGTSLLTNNTDKELRSLLIQTANQQENDLNSEKKAIIDTHIEQIKNRLPSMTLSEVKKISAELNGIITYYQDRIQHQKGTPDTHYLIVSDTYQGIKVGEIIVDWLQKNNFIAEIIRIPDLATNNRDKFRLAMSELINWCNDNLKAFRNSNYQIIFNLTGGFKSVQGFLQTVGMFYADECIYIFQFSSQLLQIPRLPIKLDLEEIVGKNLITFRRLDSSYISVTKPEVKDIPETLLFFLDDDDVVQLSEWGELIWLQAKSTYYQQELLPPLSEKLIYSNEFKQNVRALTNQPDRVERINIQCDKLSRFLDSNRQDNLTSLDFKPITTSSFSDSTHECDAWHDKDAKRLFGHNLDDGRYIIDRLSKGIH